MGEREYRIGDMARIVGMSADGLRFYEKKGVILSYVVAKLFTQLVSTTNQYAFSYL